jgi:hypothetical protein
MFFLKSYKSESECQTESRLKQRQQDESAGCIVSNKRGLKEIVSFKKERLERADSDDR